MEEAFQSVRADVVVADARALLTHPTSPYKLVQAHTTSSHKHVAVSLLVELGLCAVFQWKRAGATGFGATYIARRAKSDDEHLEVEQRLTFG